VIVHGFEAQPPKLAIACFRRCWSGSVFL